MSPRSPTFAAAMLVLATSTALAQSARPTDLLDLKDQAQSAFAANRFDHAEPLYDSLCRQNPDDGRNFARLADCRLALGRPKDAIEPLTRAIELGEIQRPDGLYRIAQCHALANDNDHALDFLSQSLDAGYRFRPRISRDKAFAKLQSDPRFTQLAGRLPDHPLTRDQGWTHDLDFLTAEVRRLHFVYRNRPLPAAYIQESDRLRKSLPTLPDQDIVLGIQRLLATLGDGHTLAFPFGMKLGKLPRLPLALYWFNDGLFIVGAPREHQHLVGRRVTDIAGLTPETLLAALTPYISRDNAMENRWTAPVYLTFPDFLRAAGAPLPPAATEVPLTLTDAQSKTTHLTLNATAEVDPDQIAIHLPPARAAATQPLAYHPDEPFLLRDLTPNAVYVQFNQVRDAKDESLPAFATRLRRHLDQRDARTLILDLRQNNGGEGSLLPELQHTILHFYTTRPNPKLYVLIGRTTFSAAQQFASFLSHDTPATFVGEPTGSRPNRPGDESPFVLPYSGVAGSIASGYHQAASKDDRVWIPPDLPVPLSSDDYFAGRDPALEAILTRERITVPPASAPTPKGD